MKFATISKEIEASEKTLNEVFANASRFEVAAQKGDFSQIAKDARACIKASKQNWSSRCYHSRSWKQS